MQEVRQESTAERPNKYRAIYSDLNDKILSGKYKPGQRIPSETQLSRSFGVSRLTVGRAMNELEAAGLIERKAGSGSFVSNSPAKRARTFGLLIPELGETEIFEPICQGIARATRITQDELLWGAATRGVESAEQQAMELCDYYVEKSVSGVFFAPLEYTPERRVVNMRILRTLESAAIPVVLLDRDVCDYPERSNCDLVGIDNRRAGYSVTKHLIELGCKRILFLASPGAAPTVGQRLAGYREAMSIANLPVQIHIGQVGSNRWIANLIAEHRPDGLACANDRTAGQAMVCLNELGIEIPSSLRIVSIDDVKYAPLLHVPLTTLRQPCHDIGAAALWTMIERIEHPGMPARDIALDCELVIRRSCGAVLAAGAGAQRN